MNRYISKLNIVAADYFAVAGVARHVCVTCGPRPVASTGSYWPPVSIAVGASGSRCSANVTASFDLPSSPSGTCDYVTCNASGSNLIVLNTQSVCVNTSYYAAMGWKQVPDAPPVIQSPIESGGRPR